MNPVDFYKCLADETRLRALLLIHRETELCVCELTAALDESQPKVSRHLAQLRKCGLLLDRRQGQWIFYRLNPGLAEWCLQVLATSLAASEEFLTEESLRLCSMGGRPERKKLCC